MSHKSLQQLTRLYINIWQAVLDEAKHSGQLHDLIDIARREYGTDPALQLRG
ncbi:MAG: hypothetical protein AAF639_16900 [Chloroflexota bacterium]